MKAIINLSIIVSFIFPSYLSMYGFGEYVEDNFSSFFITSPSEYFVENHFSSIWGKTESILRVQYNFQTGNLNEANLSNSYLASASYTFPLKRSNYCTIGINPYTISDGDFYVDEYSYISANEIASLDAPIAYNVIYSNDGGISKAYINFSNKIFDQFYLGIKYSFLFGNLEQNKKVRLYDLEYGLNDEDEITAEHTISDSISINRVNEYKGNSFQIESKYKLDNVDFIVSGTYMFPLKIRSSYFFNNSLSNLQNLEEIQTYLQPNQNIVYSNRSLWKSFSLGSRYILNPTQSLTFNLMKQNPFDYNINSMYLADPDIYSINLFFDSSSKIFTISKLNYINYKIGMFYNVIENSNSSDYNYGIYLDYGFRFLDKNYFSVSFKMGEKSHKYISLDNERYYMVDLKLENIEEWFLGGTK